MSREVLYPHKVERGILYAHTHGSHVHKQYPTALQLGETLAEGIERKRNAPQAIVAPPSEVCQKSPTAPASLPQTSRRRHTTATILHVTACVTAAEHCDLVARQMAWGHLTSRKVERP